LHFLQYWKPPEIDAEMAREALEGTPFRIAGGEQLAKMQPGDTIWVVSVNSDNYLVLYGRLAVDHVTADAAEVVRFLGRAPKFRRTTYALARSGTETMMAPHDISGIVSSLRFKGKHEFLTLRNGAVNPQQIQSIRELRRESAQLMELAWQNYVVMRPERDTEFCDTEESDIGDQAPRPSEPSGKLSDPEARRQAMDRRVQAHWLLVRDIKNLALTSGIMAKKTRYIDIVTYKGTPSNGSTIIEVKSLEDDDADQTRRAIGQLILYKFLHQSDYPNAGLLAAFTHRPSYNSLDLTTCLDNCGIGAVWRNATGFDGTALGRRMVPWLCSSAAAVPV
jgi:hypothetical protein